MQSFRITYKLVEIVVEELPDKNKECEGLGWFDYFWVSDVELCFMRRRIKIK